MRPPPRPNLCEQWLHDSLLAFQRSTQSQAIPQEDTFCEHHEQLLAAAYRGSQEECLGVIQDIAPASNPPNIIQLILPVVYRIELHWLNDRKSFSDTLLAFWCLQQLLKHHNDRHQTHWDAFANTPAARNILLSPAPGCGHSIGTLAVADFFRSSNWNTTVLIDTDHRLIVDTLSSHEFDFVGLSVGHDAGLDGLVDFLHTLRAHSRNPALQILVGGNIFTLAKSEYTWIGANFVAHSPMDALAYCMTSSPSQPH